MRAEWSDRRRAAEQRNELTSPHDPSRAGAYAART
jgi:hypothetical protein